MDYTKELNEMMSHFNMKDAMAKNLDIAIGEVEEHGYQTQATEDINKQAFIKDVNAWLRMDKDLYPYYSQVDIYNAVTEFLTIK